MTLTDTKKFGILVVILAVLVLQIGAWDGLDGRILQSQPSATLAPSNQPTRLPYKTPTNAPSKTPTNAPTKFPSKTPSKTPTKNPTKTPTTQTPSKAPTKSPTKTPTNNPTKFPTHTPTKKPTKVPTRSPTRSPTKAPTPCQSYCPVGRYNFNWNRDKAALTCIAREFLTCQICPQGMYKTTGNSWTACYPCGEQGTFCSDGERRTRSSGKCTFRSDLLANVIENRGSYGGSVSISNMEKRSYDELIVRDAEGSCGQVSASKENLDMSIIKPASSVTEFEVENIGELPVYITNFKLPAWITLFDVETGSEISSKKAIVLQGRTTRRLDFLVKSSLISDKELIKPPDFTTKSVYFVNNTIQFSAVQVATNQFKEDQIIQVAVNVHVSEPSLSLLPSDNSWTMNIGTVERRTLALYNMQVERIDWSTSVEYISIEGKDAENNWLTVSPSVGSLVQGFECTPNGEVIGTSGVNKAELVVLVNGTNLTPGKYQANVFVYRQSNPESFKVQSTIKLEVLPGVVEPSQSTFKFSGIIVPPTGNVTDGSIVSTLTDDVFFLETENTDEKLVVYQLQLPNTELEVIPRDKFGIVTSQFPEDEPNETFNVTWAIFHSADGNTTSWIDEFSSRTLLIHRNPVDNTFQTILDIRQTGQYRVEIKTVAGGRQIKGSPFIIDVQPLLCHSVPNSEPHPETGYTCVCSAGFGKSEVTGACESCPAGQYRDDSMLASTPFCRSCDLGKYQDEVNSKSCKFCPAGHQPNPVQSGCTACEDNHVVDDLSPSRNCIPCGSAFTVVNHKCVCRPEYYTIDSGKSLCNACPTGAFCGYGNRSTILPRFGFWRTSWNPLRFEKCPNEEACLGVNNDHEFYLRSPDAWDLFLASPENITVIGKSDDGTSFETIPPVDEMNACATEYTGPLCKECAPGYYPIGSSFNCFRCDSKGRTVGFLIISIIVGVGALFYLISRTIKARGAPRKREVMVLKIVLSHLQIIAMSRRFPLNWPPAIASLMSVFDILSSAGTSALSTHCLFYSGPTLDDPHPIASNFPMPDSAFESQQDFDPNDPNPFGLTDWVFFARSLAYALAPILLTLFFWFMWKVVVPLYRDTANDPLTSREKTIVSIVVLLIVMQPFLTRAGFEFFSCSEKIDGHSFLEAQYTIQCWVGNHADWIILGSLMLVFYALGIPVYSTFVLYCIVWKRSGAQALNNLSNSVRKRFSASQKSTKSSAAMNTSSFSASTHSQSNLRQRNHGKASSSDTLDDSLMELHVDDNNTHQDALERWRPVYGFIYSGYRRECFFWEIVIMTRKAAFATVSVVLRPVGVDIQTYTGLLVLVFSLVLHVHYRPYSAASRLHTVETSSLIVCFLTLMCGMLIYSPSTNENFKQVCTMLIVTSNFLFFIFVVYTIRQIIVENVKNLCRTCGAWCCGRTRKRRPMALSDTTKGSMDSEDDDDHGDFTSTLTKKRQLTEPCDADYDADEEVDMDGFAVKSSKVVKDIDLSFRLQREAEVYRSQGDFESAARVALQAASVALGTLRQAEDLPSTRKDLTSLPSKSSLTSTSQKSFKSVSRKNTASALPVPTIDVNIDEASLPKASISLNTSDTFDHYEPLASRTPPPAPQHVRFPASPPSSPSIPSRSPPPLNLPPVDKIGGGGLPVVPTKSNRLRASSAFYAESNSQQQHQFSSLPSPVSKADHETAFQTDQNQNDESLVKNRQDNSSTSSTVLDLL